MVNKTSPSTTLGIVGLSHDGRGVARLDGKTVFVEGALPGEQVSCHIQRSRPRYDEATLDQVLLASADRSTPACPHFGRCGGCSLQHLEPAAQLAAKQQQLADALQRIGGVAPQRWLEPVSAAPWGYRARARLGITTDPADGAPRLGFYREGSHQVEGLRVCPVLEPELESLLVPLTALLAQLEQPRQLQEVLLANGESGAGIAFLLRAPVHPGDQQKITDFCQQRGLGLQFSTVGGAWPEPAAALHYHTAQTGSMIAFQPWHFTQANRSVNRALITTVLELLEPESGLRALDLFCGLGNFSLPLAAQCLRVTGIEGDAALLDTARSNASANGLGNLDFVRADLAQEPGRAAWSRQRYDLVLLDPPRTGAAALIPVLARLRATRVCYISCDAATLARDTRNLLGQSGLRLQAAGVFDMFPQTGHFESIALFA